MRDLRRSGGTITFLERSCTAGTNAEGFPGVLLVAKKILICRLMGLPMAIDPVPIGGGFGFSENRKLRQVFCQNNAQSICNLNTYRKVIANRNE
jgi:hypothetical protein